ncbi:MAG: hypothetical protein ACPGRC_04225, partial [Salibacteraceae bacterium]
MSSENTNEKYPIQSFGIETVGKSGIIYHFNIISLPPLIDVNGNSIDYLFSKGEVDTNSNTLKYTITLPEGAIVSE